MSDESGAPPLDRVRRSTIERFNDEMAMLDRPLAEEGEYYDEEPPRKARRAGAIAGVVLALGAAAFVLWSRVSGAEAPAPLVIASALSVATPAPVVPVAPAPAPAPAAAAPPAPAPAAAPVAMAEPPSVAKPRAASRTAWTKAAHANGRGAHHQRRGQRH